MSTKQTAQQREGERFYADIIDNLEAARALLRRKNDAMVRVAQLVGRLEGEGKLSKADGRAFDRLFAEYGPAEEGPLSARWARMIADARRTRVRWMQ